MQPAFGAATYATASELYMRVLVIGDSMLDRYWHGHADRISPEAPVPVVHVQRIEDRAGGAANVAANIKALGASVALVSIVGDDEQGRVLRSICSSRWTCALVADSAPTTVKLRVVGRNQQLIRADFEQPPSTEALAAMMVDYEALLPHYDRVLLSDYGKGTLAWAAEIVAKAVAAGKEVLVDPKGHDWSRYRGAALVKPNRDELRDAIGPWVSEPDLERRTQQLRAELGIKAILVTRASDGMSLMDASGSRHVAAQALQVYDVTGAGDTAIACLAATEGNLFDRVILANKAAGLACQRFGTSVVHASEVFS